MNIPFVLHDELFIKDEIRQETLEIYDATVLPTTSPRSEAEFKNKKQQFQCLNCEDCYATKSALERHQRKHTRKKSLNEKIHTNGTIHKCEFCKMKFSRIQQLNDHISTKHGEGQPEQNKSNRSHAFKQKRREEATPEFGCFDCKQIFTTKAGLKRHQQRQHGEECSNEVDCQPIESMPRNSSNDTESILNGHIRSKHSDQNKPANNQDKSDKPPKGKQTTKMRKPTAMTSQITHVNEVSEVENGEGNNDTHTRITTILKKDMTFECIICKKSLKTHINLASHMALHDDKFQCKICSKSLTSADNLRKHMFIHTSEKPFQCDECPKKFRTKHHIPLHKFRYHTDASKMKFECFDCKKRFPILSLLTSHQTSHIKAKVFKCDYCDKHFKRKTYKTIHEKRYHLHTKPIPKWKNYYVERTFKCSHCPKMFKRKDHVISHEKLIHSTERPFKCGECDKSFKLKEVLKIHKRIHSKEKPFKCSFCQKSFAFHSNKQIHQRVVHTKQKPHQCKICSERFFLSTQLLIHIRSQHFDILRQQDKNTGTIHELFLGHRTYECFWCKLAGTSNTIKKHTPLCRGPKIYKCSFCDLKFCSRNNLMKHESEHECDVCKFRASSIYQIRRHKLQHGEKQFTCNICSKAFHQKGNLDLHLNIHTKPLKCDKCHWRCANTASLRQHISANRCRGPRKNRKSQKSLENIQYECFICHAPFCTKPTLRHHITYIHGERNLQCSFCPRKFFKKVNLKNHQRLHTNRLQCDFCDFRPTNRYTKLVHTWKFHLEAFKTQIEKQSKGGIVKLQYDSRLNVWN